MTKALRTDRPTSQPTYRRTDKASYRDARTHLKMRFTLQIEARRRPLGVSLRTLYSTLPPHPPQPSLCLPLFLPPSSTISAFVMSISLGRIPIILSSYLSVTSHFDAHPHTSSLNPLQVRGHPFPHFRPPFPTFIIADVNPTLCPLTSDFLLLGPPLHLSSHPFSCFPPPPPTPPTRKKTTQK